MSTTDRLFILHVSDTHYARPGETLCSLLRAQTRTEETPAAAFQVAARYFISQMKGAAHHFAKYRRDYLDRVSQVVQILQGECITILHSGDVSQAGQISSIVEELSELQKAAGDGIEMIAVPGNHDLWPMDLPVLRPTHTALQYSRIRNLGFFPSQYPKLFTLSTPVNRIHLWALDSPIADSVPNMFAVGSVEDNRISDVGVVDDSGPYIGTVSHHPLRPVDPKLARRLAQHLRFPVLNMLGATALCDVLVKQGVIVHFCGHEHRRPARPDDMPIHDNKILQLAAGTPTIGSSTRTSSSTIPQFSLYSVVF